MLLRVMGVVFGMAVVAQANADTLDMNLHNDALRVTYTTAIGPSKDLLLDAGYFYSEKRVDEEHLVHVGIQVAGQNWAKQGNFDIGVGARAVNFDTRGGGAAAIAFGGRVRFSPIPRFGLGGTLFYAPDITSYRDSDSYTEGSVFVDYQLLTQAFVYVGYRRMEFTIENTSKSYVIDDHVHVGMTLRF